MRFKRMSFSEIRPFVRYVQRIIIRPETYPHFSTVCPYDCRIFYVADGTGVLYIEGEARRMCPGQVVLWRSGVNYRMVSDEERDPLVLLGANFDYTWEMSDLTVPIPPDAMAIFDWEGRWESVEFTDVPRMNRPIQLNNMQFVEDTLQEMLREFKAQKLFCNELLSGMMGGLLVHICRNVSLSESERNVSVAKMERVLDYIHAHYAEPINNETLGKQFGYHPNYLNRQIKLYTSKSMYQYLIHYRIARAIDLLVATDMSISEIAVRVGFRDLCHFSRIFKSKIGCSPGQMRSNGGVMTDLLGETPIDAQQR